MDIGFPTNVRHISHVTFDRLQGFLGLPIEFELEVPRRVPSASTSAFGVSAESMQCSFDAYGNSVPTILLLLQERLYEQGGLKTEGIFRINPDNDKEDLLRDQLNKGIVPYDIDVHCLAGLIKAWFRELPKGVLDSLSPEQVMQCHTEDQCMALVKTLPPTQAALFDWAINLMADVVQEEACNKMNARNVAVVFAPNMTQMLDPLTALKHAVQVMNLLRTLILKTLKDRERSVIPTSVVAWNDPLTGEKEKQNSTRLLQVININSSKRGTPTNRGHDSFKNIEACNNSGAVKMSSLAKAFAAGTEIVEETGSVNGSEWSPSAYSSGRGSRDEDGHALLDDQRRLSDRWVLWGDGGTTDDSSEDKLEQSQPFATLLRKGRPTVTKNKCGDNDVVNCKGPCSDGLRAPQNSNPTLCRDKSCKKQSGLGNQKPLADWLHCKPSPPVALRLVEEVASLEKGEKPKSIKPLAEKPALAECRTRVTHPLSKRTHYLKNNGMV